jgi:hypothetical protein
VLICLALLRVVLPWVKIPLPVAEWLSIGVTLVFLAAPILALYRAAAFAWRAGTAWAVTGVGLALHGAAILAGALLRGQSPVFEGSVSAVGQTGLILWTVGLGVLLATTIKDKNLLWPVGIFLAGFDIFTVVSEFGVTRRVLEQRPEVFHAVAYQVPTVGSPEPQAFVGPADMFFLAMFFVALYRFGMRVRETFLWMLPTLAAYLLMVIFLGHVRVGPISLAAVPALVPIGAVILLVNRHEFSLSRTEKLATLCVGAVALALAMAGFLLPGRQAAPSRSDSAPLVPGSANSPVPTPAR